MRRLVIAVVLMPVAVVFAVAAVASGPRAPTAELTTDVRGIYESAVAAQCPGLPWSVLAAVGWVESRHGGSRLDPTVGDVLPPILGPPLDGRDGRQLLRDPMSIDGYVHARGPMQFLPATWQRWQRHGPDRPVDVPASIDNLADAAAAAAAMLCADGAATGDIEGALFAYNHSDAYVARVLAVSARYASTADALPTSVR